MIVPGVVYHGLEAWRVSRQFADGVVEVPALRAYVPECVYHLVDLSDYRDEELRGAVVLNTALLVLKCSFRNELREGIWRSWRSGGTSSGDQDLNGGIWGRL